MNLEATQNLETIQNPEAIDLLLLSIFNHRLHRLSQIVFHVWRAFFNSPLAVLAEQVLWQAREGI